MVIILLQLESLTIKKIKKIICIISNKKREIFIRQDEFGEISSRIKKNTNIK